MWRDFNRLNEVFMRKTPTYNSMLIPPVDYKDVSDEDWEKAFGRVNKYVEKADELGTGKIQTYEQYLQKKLNAQKEKQRTEDTTN